MDVIAADNEMVGPEGVETEDLFAFNPSEEILTLSETQNRLFVAAFGLKSARFRSSARCFTRWFTPEARFQCVSIYFAAGFLGQIQDQGVQCVEKIWVGMVNSMMEPAEYKNKALTELMFDCGEQ